MKLAPLFLLAAAVFAHAEVKVELGAVTENHGTGGLNVELKLSGPELADCKRLRVTLKEVRDDSGTIVQKDSSDDDRYGWSHPWLCGPSDEANKKEQVVTVALKRPSRGAKSLALDGTVELYSPTKDPASVVSFDLAKNSGEGLQNASFWISFDTSSSYTLSDPNHKVVFVEFCSADGKAMIAEAVMGNGWGSTKHEGFSFKEKETPKIAKIYFITDKSVTRAPVKLDKVMFP